MRPRSVAILLVFVLDVALVVPLLHAPSVVSVYPLAPPLTRTSALGDHPLAGPLTGPLSGRSAAPPPPGALRMLVSRILHKVGTPEEQRQMADLEEQARHMSEFRERGAALRMVIEADASAIAGALGPERVAAIVAAKDTLAVEIGEGRLWARTGQALSR